jgi:CBS domain-containing protein
VKVKDLMSRHVVTVAPGTSLKAAAALLVKHRISGLPVCDAAGAVVGVVSEADILVKEQGRDDRQRGVLARLLADTPLDEAKIEARTAGDAMSAPPITIGPNRPAASAARLMVEEGVNRLPVVSRDGELVGIVTRADLVRAFVRRDDQIEREIAEEVLRRALWAEPGAVRVRVRGGDVQLDGELESTEDVTVLERLVGRVPGVVSVRSNVRGLDRALARR